MAGGMSRKGDDFSRETLAERVANTRARHAEHSAAPNTSGSTAGGSTTGGPGRGHGTADLHGKRPNAPASWTAPPAVPPTPTSPPPPLKHCWYDGPFGRQPALLVKWRCIQGHYDGLVILAAPDEAGTGWCVVEMWTDSALPSPAWPGAPL